MSKLTGEDREVLSALCDGRWWAAVRLANIVGKTRPETSKVLRRLKRRGYAEADVYLWQATEAGRAALTLPKEGETT